MEVSAQCLTVSSLTLGKAPFRERVRAAAAAGFTGLGLSVENYAASLRDGLDDQAMTTILDRHGIAVTEVEFLSDWVPGPGEARPSAKEAAAFHIARVFGADHVNVGLFQPTPWDLMVRSFTALCERAGEIRIALEFMPFGAVPDLATAWDLVRLADRPNAGLLIDVWHWVRGAAAAGDLGPVPAERVFAVQLCDVGADPLADMRHESLHFRLAPGTRTDSAQNLLELLARHGVAAELSAEVMSDALLAKGLDATAKTVFETTSAVLAEHRRNGS
jgi:sugar phosphate isomerase/epimerase